MSFDWSEYLTLAQELASTSTNSPIKEAKLRSAISRAYYASFCKARNLLISKEGPIPYGVNVHWYVVDKFETSSQAVYQTIGQFLHHLRSTRNIIDYKDKFHGDLLSTTKGVLVEAEEVIRLLGTL